MVQTVKNIIMLIFISAAGNNIDMYVVKKILATSIDIGLAIW